MTHRLLVVALLLSAPSLAWAGQLTLTWTDHATEEEGFRVERCKVAVGSTTCANFAQVASVGALPGLGEVQWTQTGLVVGTTFCYRVRAYNATGTSGYSNEACAMVPDLPLPTAPSDLTVQ